MGGNKVAVPSAPTTGKKPAAIAPGPGKVFSGKSVTSQSTSGFVKQKMGGASDESKS